MILTNGKASGQYVDSGTDNLGRWTFQTLTCKGAQKITLISAYQVCEQSIVTNSRIKTLTATAQQVSILRQQGRYDTTPREAFVKDLTKFIHKKREEGSGILLMGDFNEALDVTYDGMTKMCSKLGLEDIMF